MVDNSLIETLETRYFVPSWWVKAFDSSVGNDVGTNFEESLIRFDIGPTFALKDLTLFPLVLSQIQRQLIHNSSPTLCLNPREIVKDSGLVHQGQILQLFSVLKSIGSLKLYLKHEARTDVIQIFEKEWWQNQDSNALLHLNLRPASLEYMFGVVNGYGEIARIVSQLPSVRNVLGHHKPLLLRKSIWHEVRGIEQLTLLRLEKAKQWGVGCFNLIGTYGESFDHLFLGTESPKSKRKKRSFVKKIEYLNRFSLKLSEHGLLSTSTQEEFMAFGENEPAIQFFWNSSNMTEYNVEEMRYLKGLSEIFVKQSTLVGDLLSMTRSLASTCPLDDERLANIFSCLEISSKEFDLSELFYVIDGNTLISVEGLYWDWVLRKDRYIDVKLPDSIKCLDIFKNLPRLESTPDVHNTAFKHLFTFLSEKESFVNEIENCPGVSVASKVSLSLLDKYIPSRDRGHKMSSEAKSFESTTTKHDLIHEIGAPSQSEGETSTEHVSIKNTNSKEKKLNRRAQIEHWLEKRRGKHRKSYTNVMNEYLESLEDDARNLILDIKGRMQPKIFEKHIQNRLVKFLNDRPDLWQGNGL